MTAKKTPAKSSGPKKTKSSATPKKKSFTVSFYHDWCKQCGLCVAFCPKEIITAAKSGKPSITDQEKCIGCRFCEMHCPDFAITVEVKTPKRRKTDE